MSAVNPIFVEELSKHERVGGATESATRANVLRMLKAVDKQLYEYHRDYRVSGSGVHNSANRAWVVRCENLMLSTERFLAKIHKEASKDNRTGNAKP